MSETSELQDGTLHELFRPTATRLYTQSVHGR